MSSTNAKNVIDKMIEFLNSFELRKQIVTDNGLPFTSKNLENFMKHQGIDHICIYSSVSPILKRVS